MMKIIKGNLLDLAEQGEFDIIVHGCNCFHTMGSGIAKQIKDRWPNVYDIDVLFSVKGDKEKLGCYTHAKANDNLTVINAYTQYDFSGSLRGEVDVDYGAIRKVFRLIKRNHIGRKIGYPRIGAGLAGGDWAVISKIINEELKGEDHTLVEYEETEKENENRKPI